MGAEAQRPPGGVGLPAPQALVTQFCFLNARLPVGRELASSYPGLPGVGLAEKGPTLQAAVRGLALALGVARAHLDRLGARCLGRTGPLGVSHPRPFGDHALGSFTLTVPRARCPHVGRSAGSPFVLAV